MGGRHSQIVDVDLTALPLGLLQFIGCKPTDNCVVFQRSESNEMFTAEQALEIVRAGPSLCVSIEFSESLTEVRKHGFHQRDINRR